jgi:hypothetical protein
MALMNPADIPAIDGPLNELLAGLRHSLAERRWNSETWVDPLVHGTTNHRP